MLTLASWAVALALTAPTTGISAAETVAFERCPGHEVMIEDGTAEGRHVGIVKARSAKKTITYRVTEAPGTLIRYFCHINNHDTLGQTAILRVV
ncbi:hypothetical protein GCM10009547_11300 [Sporichthya brevicatena]|uniref:Uncharacterized protein n=1 Tax=Sporichthya brevicatena TaxID=171442 RepID=A0ABP3RIG2_9ACTN